jgi:hypothetical protein
MQTIELSRQADADRRLRLEIPVDKTGVAYRVVVTIEECGSTPVDARGWPAGYFERIPGAWIGDLERPLQLPLETREAL